MSRFTEGKQAPAADATRKDISRALPWLAFIGTWPWKSGLSPDTSPRVREVSLAHLGLSTCSSCMMHRLTLIGLVLRRSEDGRLVRLCLNLILQITRELRSLADGFRDEHPGWGDMPTRQQALLLVHWLRTKGLVGMNDESSNYRNLRNTLIGQALSEDGHDSLPLVSCAIYCCVAENLGLTAACASIPNHVHVVVHPPPGRTLDDKPASPGQERGDVEEYAMFLDPYGSDGEVSLLRLRDNLSLLGWDGDTNRFFLPSPVTELVLRTARNIRATYLHSQENVRFANESLPRQETNGLREGFTDINLEAAAYAAMWAELLMQRVADFDWASSLDTFLNRFALSFAEDAWIVERQLLPLYDSIVRQHPPPPDRWQNVREMLGMLATLDSQQPLVNRRRTEEIEKRVKYRIGQVFRHRRYHYIGIINGWASDGADTLPTPHYSSPREVEHVTEVAQRQPGGRAANRTYYTCL